jgi:hypothetical protein
MTPFAFVHEIPPSGSKIVAERGQFSPKIFSAL